MIFRNRLQKARHARRLGPIERYRDLVASGAVVADSEQEGAMATLAALDEALTRRPFVAWLARAEAQPRGVYLFGPVGRGKSMLMDIFYNNASIASKQRAHFLEFMAKTHERLAEERGRTSRFNGPASDPIAKVAEHIAREGRLVCFDEFQVADIADAMILGRLFEALFARGVVLVATSNRAPDDLYKDGLNRQLFLPFIDMLRLRCDVLELAGPRDWRLERLTKAPVYYSPLGDAAERAMDAAWSNVIAGARERSETIEVKGRALDVARSARGAARFSFEELCARPLGPEDYLALARHYATLFIDDVPRLGHERRNEARRFLTLIDALYEAKTKLVCSAAAAPHELYPEGEGAFEFQRAASRLVEMQTPAYLAAAHAAPVRRCESSGEV